MSERFAENKPAATAASLQTNETEYMEKWKQLQKYVEPLKRMIVKIEHDKGLTICR